MTLTLAQILDAEQALKRLSAERMPIKTSWLVARLAKAVGAEVAAFHEQRNALIMALGIEKDGQRLIEEHSPNLPAFVAQVNELVSVSVELPWTPLPQEQLGDIAISPADLLALGPFLGEAPCA
jgi:hypothetical protein